MHRRPFAVALSLALLAASPARSKAHEHWFSPSDYVAARGRTVEVRARVGETLCGPARPYDARRTVRFALRAERTLDLAPLAANGDSVWARFAASDDAGALLAFESNFAGHVMEATKFDDYLASDGLDGPLAARRAARDTSAGRERYRRCTKLWLAASPAASAADRAAARERSTAPMGLPLELVPLDVPGARAQLDMRVIFHGRPLANALVQAWYAPFASGASPFACGEDRRGRAEQQVRTGADGVARIRCAAPGEWLVSAVHMVPSEARDAADWESTWASLGFGRVGEADAR